jgi:pyroglutamyl-peptidase
MPPFRLLLTGFGPFPGASENPSAWLVETLARSAPPLDCSLHAEILPTEWNAVLRAPALFNALKPRLILHFGLNRRARRFRIERFAHNHVMARADAAGALPTFGRVLPDGHDRLDSPLPAAKLAAHLQQQGLPAAASRAAGDYLCNFLYYLSLDWAGRQDTPCLAAFVHIPPESARGGSFNRPELLRGAQTILRFALACARDTGGQISARAATGTALAHPRKAINSQRTWER